LGSPVGDLPESFAGSLALSVAYGLNVESEYDMFYAKSEEANKAFAIALMPGAFLVDALPIRTSSSLKKGLFSAILTVLIPTVKYVPEWFPGAGFKRFARLAKKNFEDSVNLPLQYVKKSLQVCELYLSCEGLGWNEI
jgi:hypothetical protein